MFNLLRFFVSCLHLIVSHSTQRRTRLCSHFPQHGRQPGALPGRLLSSRVSPSTPPCPADEESGRGRRGELGELSIPPRCWERMTAEYGTNSSEGLLRSLEGAVKFTLRMQVMRIFRVKLNTNPSIVFGSFPYRHNICISSDATGVSSGLHRICPSSSQRS